MEPMTPALAGGFLTTEPLGKSPSEAFVEKSTSTFSFVIGRIEFLATTETEPEMQRMMYEHQGRTWVGSEEWDELGG